MQYPLLTAKHWHISPTTSTPYLTAHMRTTPNIGKYSGGNVPEGSRLGLEQYKNLADKKLREKRAQLDAVDQLAPIAKELDCTLAQVRRKEEVLLRAVVHGVCCSLTVVQAY